MTDKPNLARLLDGVPRWSMIEGTQRTFMARSTSGEYLHVSEVAAALSAAPPMGMKVRPLEWNDAAFLEQYAKSVAGTYRVFEKNGLWRATVHTVDDAHFIAETEALDAAKAAAQADYDARILAALSAAPPMGVKVKPLVWRQAGGNIREGEGYSSWPDLVHAPITTYKTNAGWWLSSDCKTHPTLDAAKAAAQADYDARILAALSVALPADMPARIEDYTLAQLEADLASQPALPADVAGVVEEAGKNAVWLRNNYGGHLDANRFDDTAQNIRALIDLAQAQAAQIAGLEAKVAEVTSDRAFIIGANAGWEAAVEQDEASPAAVAMLARAEAAETALAEERAKVARLVEALQWCSGSDDFQEGGKAREGWLKLCAPLLHGEAGK